MLITNFKKIYYEKDIEKYPLGKYLLNKYSNIPKFEIDSHNNILELRSYENKQFPQLKNYLIIGTRKTHKYTENHKISDFLVPFTSSGCSAMCMYCYLVCNYNKCSYLRIFVNTQEILDKLIKTANKLDERTVYEIGSNSDLLLENLVTDSLSDNLNYFLNNTSKGILTFPTKFDFIDPLLKLDHKNRILPRMSLNPQEIITKVEFGTSNLKERIEAINKLTECGYPTHILIAPVILIDGYMEMYTNMIKTMKQLLSPKAQQNITFEVIFMTYSYIHQKINEDAFPKAINLYNKELMTSRGVGKYHYKESVKNEVKEFIEKLLIDNFKNCKIKYIV